jgi:protoheme ferro-lyase
MQPPFVEEVIENETRSLMIVSISFMSEYVETCVEHDVFYKQKAKKTLFCGRVLALGVRPVFMNCLANLVHQR